MQTLPGDHSLDTRPVMVTIHCTAYNHEPFIRQCLDGFIMQKTDFRFEAIVHDDASTDGTADIIREYASKYPEIIKPIYQIENQYSKKNGIIKRILNDHTRGKYIAICEGDDYWTDPLKLQKQVDFLESHPDYVMCSHFWKEYFQNSNTMDDCKNVTSKTYTLKNLIGEEWLFQPLTILYKKDVLNNKKEYKVSRDTILIYRLLKEGKGFCLSDYMGVYRRHDGGIWAGKDDTAHWLSEYSVREAIYDTERTDEAAQFLLNAITTRPIGRSFLLRKYNYLWHIFSVTCHHKGLCYAIFIILKRISIPKI